MDLPVAEGRVHPLMASLSARAVAVRLVGALGGANSRQGVSCGAQEPIVGEPAALWFRVLWSVP